MDGCYCLDISVVLGLSSDNKGAQELSLDRIGGIGGLLRRCHGGHDKAIG
jgi:hypothetical protein